MKVYSFDEVVSTSTLASQWLETRKVQTPFAISAASQEHGRGRQGRSWQSPIGNMYLSIALDAKDPALRSVNLLPLRAGVLIAKWLHEEFGISVTLKWPNDILFGGAKLGGILCESSVRGSVISGAVVGIGLNILKAPRITGTYASCSLSQVLARKDLDPEKLAKSFCRYWDAHSDSLTPLNIIEAFSGFSMDEGHVWESQDGKKAYSYEGVGNDGAMLLQDIRGDEGLLSVTSVADDLRWSLQNVVTEKQVEVCDIGNSRIKFACFAGPRSDEVIWDEVFPLSDIDSPKLKSLLAKLKGPLFVMSVNAETLQRLDEIMEGLGKSLIRLRKRRILSFGDSYAFANIGADRLAAIEAAISQLKNPAPIVVVSAGTATTVDFVSKDREHLGGWIVPGVATSLKALHDATSALPDLSKVLPDEGPRRIGVDTASAMLGGVANMQAGLINYAVDLLSKHDKEDPAKIAIYVCGGFAEWIPADRKKLRVDPLLILKGIRMLAARGV